MTTVDFTLKDGTVKTVDFDGDVTQEDLEEMENILNSQFGQPQPQPQPQPNESQVLTGEVQQNIRQELDKKGRVHFIDADTGEEIKSDLNPLQKVGRKLKATGENIRSFMTQDYGEPLKARQKAGAMVLSSLLPAGQGIGAMALSGALGSGLYSGAEQFVDEGKIKPSKLAIDTALGGALGGALGLGGKYIGKQIAKAQRKNEVLKRRKLNFEERMTPEQKANYEAKLLTPEEATQIEQEIAKQPRVSSKVQPEVETPEVINLGGPVAKTEDLAKITPKEMPTMAQTAENVIPEEQVAKNIGNEIKPRQSAKTVESASGIKLEDKDILNYEVRHQQELIDKAKSLSPEERNNIIHSDRLDDEATAVRIAELQLAKENGQVPSTALLNKLVTSGTEQGQALSMRQQLNAYSPEGAILAIRKGNLEGVSKQAKTVIGNSEKIAKELQPLMESSPENAAVEAQFNKWLEEMPNKIKKQYSQKGDKLALMKAMERHRVSMAKKEMAAIEKYSNQKVKEKAKQQLKEKLALEREEAKAIKQLLKEEQKKHANIQKVLTKFGASEKASRSIIKELMTLKQNEGLTQENLATILDRAYGVKQISKQDLDEITNLTDAVANAAEGTREQDIARGFVDKFIKNKIPVGTWDIVNSFRYQNMLLSGKSRFKDIFSTALVSGEENLVKPLIAYGIDRARVGLGKGLGKVSKPLGDFFGTQPSVALPQLKEWGRGFKKGASEGVYDIRNDINTLRSGQEYRYQLPNYVFNYKPLEGGWQDILKNATEYIPATGERALRASIAVPDRAFYEAAYAQSLANQMKAAGVSEPSEAMLNQAVKEAKEAVFQDESWVAKLSKGSREFFNKPSDSLNDFLFQGKNVIPQFGNWIEPFVTTPANLVNLGLKRVYGIPSALARGLTARGNLTQEEIRDTVNLAAEGGLGTMYALGLGVPAGLGILKGNLGRDDYRENEVSGLQPQSVVIPNTNKAISLKNFPQISIPAATTAAIARSLNEGESVPQALSEGLQMNLRSATEMSALKSLNDAVIAIQRAQKQDKGFWGQAGNALGDMSLNLVSQLNPAGSMQNEWGNVFYPQASELQTDNTLGYSRNRLLNSTFGGRDLLPPKYNALGKPVMRNNLETKKGRALSEIFDIGVRNYNEEDTQTYRDLENLKKQAKEQGINNSSRLGAKKLPRAATVGKEKIKLTNEQYSEAQKIYGRLQNDLKAGTMYSNVSNKDKIKDMIEYDIAAEQLAFKVVLGDKYSVKKPSKYLNRVIEYYNNNLYEK